MFLRQSHFSSLPLNEGTYKSNTNMSRVAFLVVGALLIATNAWPTQKRNFDTFFDHMSSLSKQLSTQSDDKRVQKRNFDGFLNEMRSVHELYLVVRVKVGLS